MAMQLLKSLIFENFPPKSKFSIEDIPDLTGRIAIVTGAHSGIGKQTAKVLLDHNATVYVAARSKDKAESALEELKQETGRDGIFLQLDLSDFDSVKRAAEEFQGKEYQLHMLFNNAGVMYPPIEQVTAQGYDLQFGTNVLGHFYFTKLLLPTLLATARTSPDGTARVMNTSSLASMFPRSVDFNAFKDGRSRKAMGTAMLYCQSKLGNAILSSQLAQRYGDQGLVSVALNPGNLKSDLQRHLNWIQDKLVSLILYPIEFGALTQLWAATSEDGATMNGKYLIPWARYGSPNPLVLDDKLGNDLWAWLEEQVASM